MIRARRQEDLHQRAGLANGQDPLTLQIVDLETRYLGLMSRAEPSEGAQPAHQRGKAWLRNLALQARMDEQPRRASRVGQRKRSDLHGNRTPAPISRGRT